MLERKKTQQPSQLNIDHSPSKKRKLFNTFFGPYNKYAEIHLAVLNNQIDLLQNLLIAGANPDQPDQDDGWTPLLWAASKRNLDSIKLLLEYKADPNIPSQYGTTPIIIAMQVAGRADDIHVRYFPTPTPARCQELLLQETELTRTIATLLLEHGADPHLTNYAKEDAFKACPDQHNLRILNEACKQVKDQSQQKTSPRI